MSPSQIICNTLSTSLLSLTLLLSALAPLASTSPLPLDSDTTPTPPTLSSPNTLATDPPETRTKSGWDSLSRKWKERIFALSALGVLLLSVGVFFLTRWILKRRAAKKSKAAEFEKLADEEEEGEVVVVRAPRADAEMEIGVIDEEEEDGLIEREMYGEFATTGKSAPVTVTRPGPCRKDSWAGQHMKEEKGKEVVRPGVTRERSWSFEKGQVGQGVETAYLGGRRAI